MQGATINGKYEIARKLGQGGMGAVYEGRHLGTGRRIAVKVIVPEALAAGGEIIQRFQREARASGATESQHVVQIIDAGVDDATKSPFIVMEYLTGEDLQQVIQRVGPIDPSAVLRIFAQACQGLSRAHQEGIVHRDIKAANLFVARREEGDLVVKILDFGIAKVRADPMASSAREGLTRTGALLGSPLYMAPEQIGGGKDVDPRSDIFSLGVTMYEALAGATPNQESDTIGALVLAICGGKGKPLLERAPWVPREVAAIVERAMALDPGARFQEMAQMHAAIAALLPNGAALHEPMLVSASAQALAGTALDVAGPPAAPTAEAAAIRETSSTFASTRSSPRRFSTTTIMATALVALVSVAGLGSLLYKLRREPVVSVASSGLVASSPVPPSSEPVASAAPLSATTTAAVITPSADVDASDGHPAPTTASRPTPGSAPSSLPVSRSKSQAPGPGQTKPTPNCNPNFYYENGVKHFKEECL